MSTIQIYPFVTNEFNKCDKIRAKAKTLGLDAIEETFYNLVKTGVKNPSKNGIPDSGHMIRGVPFLVGDGNVVWLILETVARWFSTSPILSCTPTENGFKIETENSHYELNKC